MTEENWEGKDRGEWSAEARECRERFIKWMQRYGDFTAIHKGGVTSMIEHQAAEELSLP